MNTLCTRAWGSLAIGAAALLTAQTAAAQDCETDADCRAGFVCETTQVESCSGEMCKPGETCPDPTCETIELKRCANAPCTVNADCPDSMLCWAQTSTECSGGMPGCDPAAAGCAGGGATTDAGVAECHEVTGDPTCVARYVPPCTADADCGNGFKCIEQIYTVCSGGGMGGAGGKPAAEDAGAAAADSGTFECHEESSGTFYCQLQVLPCDTTNDCAAGLECQYNPSSGTCASDGGTATTDGGTMTPPGSAGAGGSTGVGGSVSTEDSGMTEPRDGGSSGCSTDPSVPAMVCAPPDYYNGMDSGGGTGEGGATGGDGGVVTKDAGVEPPNGSGGTTGGGAGSGDDGSHHGDGHGHHFPRFGCSVSGAEQGSQLASWFGLIGVVAFGLRRRARRVG